ncbi:MAG: SrfA family protein [Deltaproteobacteria bacterium]|jgi:outer membrane biosynthesis protein TonB|nr:SrfA family protein [Deltaproteobacteria bacterium]
MPRQLIHSSNILEYHIDTRDGVEMISRYYLFCQLIAEELSDDRAQLLAEPVKNLDHNRVNWYSNLPGQVTPYEDLSPEDQRYAREILEERKQELKKLAEKFLLSSARNRHLAGDLLSHILSQPDRYQIYMVGGRPVVAGWGLTPIIDPDAVDPGPDAPKVLSAQLTGTAGSGLSPSLAGAATSPSPGSPARPVAPQASPLATMGTGLAGLSFWKLLLGLLLGFLLLALAFYFFFPRARTVVDQAVAPPVLDLSAFDRNSDEEEALRRELEELKRRYAEKLASCPRPEVPTAPVAPAPNLPLTPAEAPAPQPDTPPVVEDPPAVEPPPEPSEPPKPPKPPKSDNLEIPEGAEKKNDLSFMEGCWVSASKDLTSEATGRPIVVKYCFNAKGNAVVTVDETDERGRFFQKCSTTAQATFSRGSLVIQQRGGPVCPKDGSHYSQSKMVCTPKKGGAGEASCVIHQPNLPPITTTFRRSKS